MESSKENGLSINPSSGDTVSAEVYPPVENKQKQKNSKYLRERLRRFFPNVFAYEEEVYTTHLLPLWEKIRKCIHSQREWKDKVKCINEYIDNCPELKTLPVDFSSKDQEMTRRNLIGVEKRIRKVGFEAFVIHWKKNATTPIHGHPSFAFYRVLQGRFNMNLYRLNTNGVAELEDKRKFNTGDFIYGLGKKKFYHNMIHRIECIEEGYTLNLYSENVQRGVYFSLC